MDCVLDGFLFVSLRIRERTGWPVWKKGIFQVVIVTKTHIWEVASLRYLKEVGRYR